jgi:hypothetical protein
MNGSVWLTATHHQRRSQMVSERRLVHAVLDGVCQRRNRVVDVRGTGHTLPEGRTLADGERTSAVFHMIVSRRSSGNQRRRPSGESGPRVSLDNESPAEDSDQKGSKTDCVHGMNQASAPEIVRHCEYER